MKKICAIFLAIVLCVSMATCVMAEDTVERKNDVESYEQGLVPASSRGNIAVLWGEMTDQKTFSSFQINSYYSSLKITVNVIGNSGVGYYCILVNENTGKAWLLDEPYANGGEVTTTVYNVPAGNYHIYMAAYGSSTEVGVVIRIDS